MVNFTLMVSTWVALEEWLRARLPLNIIHFGFISPLLQQLLKGHCGSSLLRGGLQAFPGVAQLRRTLRIAQGGRIENLAVHGPNDITERNFSRRTGQQIPAL